MRLLYREMNNERPRTGDQFVLFRFFLCAEDDDRVRFLVIVEVGLG